MTISFCLQGGVRDRIAPRREAFLSAECADLEGVRREFGQSFDRHLPRAVEGSGGLPWTGFAVGVDYRELHFVHARWSDGLCPDHEFPRITEIDGRDRR